MKILAPFDQTHTSQATIPLLHQLAGMSPAGVEITLISVFSTPIGSTPQRSARDRVTVPSHSQERPAPLPDLELRPYEMDRLAAERVLSRLHNYLFEIARRLPPGLRVNTEAHISDRPRRAINECASYREVDLIVMATRSRPRASSLLFGSTTEAVIDSGIAPTLVVHPDEARARDETDLELLVTRRARLSVTRAWLR